MKFVFLVEGHTEKDCVAEFLKRWIDPQLKRPVGIQIVRFNGYAEFTRKLVTKARMYLDGPQQQEIVTVVGLLDLYGPDFYPDHAVTPAERYNWGIAHFEGLVDRERFRMFFAVHEFEAWLLSQPNLFHADVRTSFPGKIAQPETVNFNEPPAKLLDRLYKQRLNRNYKKTTYGKELFARLYPSIAAAKCPYLMAMLSALLKLAKDVGL